MKNSRIRSGLAAAVAVATIGVVSLGLTGAESAAGDIKAKPATPTPVATDQPIGTMTVTPPGGAAFDVDIYSLQVGAGVAVSDASGAGRTTSRPSVSEMVVTRKVDSKSPIFFRYLTTGRILPEVDVVGTLKDGTAFAYELSNVIISGQSASAGGSDFGENMSLNFTKITTAVGAESTTYDLATARTE